LSETTEEVPKPAKERPFKEWYAKNAGKWNKRRRARYANDPAYRAIVLERNRKHRSEEKKKEQAESKKKHKARKVRVKSRWKTVKIRGKPYFTIGALADRLGVSVQAIRLWERQGVIPPPAHRIPIGESDDGGQRLYRLEEIEKIRAVLKAQDRLKKAPSEVLDPVRQYERDVIYPDGTTKLEKLYTVGVLARAVTRTVVTLEHLERKGYLPETPLRGSSVGRRLYTKEMIEVVKGAFDKRPDGLRGAEAWKEFYEEVLQGWTAAGVVGASLKKAA
jgi:DNA-binding transcriptional MerR regulator